METISQKRKTYSLRETHEDALVSLIYFITSSCGCINSFYCIRNEADNVMIDDEKRSNNKSSSKRYLLWM